MEFSFVYPDGFSVSVERSKCSKFLKSLEKNDKIEIFDRLKSILNGRVNFDEISALHGITFEKCKACRDRIAKYTHIEYELKVDEGCKIYFYDKVFYKSPVRYCHSGRNSKCPASNLNTNSAEFYSLTIGISKEEALSFLKSKNKSPFYRENFESEEEYASSQRRDLNFFVKKYGEKEGLKREKEFYEKIKNSLSKEEFESRHGEGSYEKFCKNKDSYSLGSLLRRGLSIEEAQRKNEEVKRKTRNSLEGFILRHGEEIGKEKYAKHVSKRSHEMSEKFYIEKYGVEKGREVWKSRRQGFACTLEKFMLKHGKEKGEEIYRKWKESKNTKIFFSSESVNFMKEIIEKTDKKCYYGDQEFRLWDPLLKRVFFYDFYFPEKRLVIEYDTPFYHPNPEFMSEEEFFKWSNPFVLMNPEEKYRLDMRKEELLKENGYNFYRCYIRNEDDKKLNKEAIKKLLS